jgi:hypothetical protein
VTADILAATDIRAAVPVPATPVVAAVTTQPAPVLDLTMPGGNGGSSGSALANPVGSGGLVARGGRTNSVSSSATLAGTAAEGPSAVPLPGASGSGASTQTNGNIAVALVQQPAAGQDGAVAVGVPREVVTAGQPFSFRLPAEIGEGATADVRVSLADGSALPGWLSYNPDTRMFSVAAGSTQQLPVKVLAVIGRQRWTVTIAENTGR